MSVYAPPSPGSRYNTPDLSGYRSSPPNQDVETGRIYQFFNRLYQEFQHLPFINVTQVEQQRQETHRPYFDQLLDMVGEEGTASREIAEQVGSKIAHLSVLFIALTLDHVPSFINENALAQKFGDPNDRRVKIAARFIDILTEDLMDMTMKRGINWASRQLTGHDYTNKESLILSDILSLVDQVRFHRQYQDMINAAVIRAALELEGGYTPLRRIVYLLGRTINLVYQPVDPNKFRLWEVVKESFWRSLYVYGESTEETEERLHTSEESSRKAERELPPTISNLIKKALHSLGLPTA